MITDTEGFDIPNELVLERYRQQSKLLYGRLILREAKKY
jgi:hypothetical protein